MPTIASILETALYVEDMKRSIAFYQALFEFPLILSEERISTLRVTDRSVLLLFKQGASLNRPPAGGTALGHDAVGQSHVAFAIGAQPSARTTFLNNPNARNVRPRAKFSDCGKRFPRNPNCGIISA